MKLFVRYLKPYIKPIMVLFLFLAAQSACEILLPTLLATMINEGVSKSDATVIYKMGGLMGIVTVVAFSFALLSSFFAAKTATKLGANLREQVFFKVEEFSFHEIDQIGTSSLITRTTNDITQVQTFVTFIVRIGMLAPLMAISGVVMAIITGRSLALTLVVAVPLMVLVILLTLKSATKLFKSMQGKIDGINRVLRENLTGIRVIRAFQRSEYEIGRFDQINDDYARTSIKVQRIMGLLMPAITLIMAFTTIGVMYFGGLRVEAGSMNVGNLVAYVQYITQILMSVMMISMIFVMYPRASASIERITEVLDMELSIQNNGNLLEEPMEKGYIEFKNVSFYYPDAEEPVLKDISFTAKPGETTGIIGSTGSGKSTVAKLIPRFYDVSEGEILIDGVNIQSYEEHALRKKIGYVPQKGALFTGTITENIKFGKQEATMEEVVHAAEISQSMEFIQGRENQFDDMIAQGGSNVSGGQKQRLSIARALVKKPEIYLFDDSFSALDLKTDSALRRALKGETTGATVIMIAQRVSSIMHATRIVVLEDGEVAGIGTHEELLQNCTVYEEIVASQFKKEGMGK